MAGTYVKTNERPGTRAVLRHSRMSAYKAREVLDLIREVPAGEALEILRLSGRDAAIPIAKLLASAVANAQNNDMLDPDELYVATAYADESVTMKRWRPRARGRATRIRKRTCHVTLVVSRLPEDKIARLSARREAIVAERRSRRVAASRKVAEETASETPSSSGSPVESSSGALAAPDRDERFEYGAEAEPSGDASSAEDATPTDAAPTDAAPTDADGEDKKEEDA